MLSHSESLKEKFIRKGFWIYLFVILTAPLGYIIKIVLASDLSKSEVGILYTSISLLMLIGTYTDLGLTESLYYFLPKYIIRKSYEKVKFLMSTTILVQLLSSVTVGLLLYFGADFIADHYLKDPQAREVLQILSLFFFGIHLLQINTSFFFAIQEVKYQKGIEFFRMFMTVIGVLVLFFSENGNLITYVWSWIGGVYLALILGMYLNYRYYFKEHFIGVPFKKDPILLREFFRYSLGTLLAANIGILLHQLDQQFIAYFVGTEEAGTYTMYLSLIGIPFIFFSPIISFLFPVVSELHEKGSKEKLKTLYTFFTSYLGSLTLWISGLFLLLGPQIAVFLFSDKYILSGTATQYMSIFLVWNILIQISFQFLGGLGYIKKRITITGATLVVNILLVLFMIWLSKNSNILPSASSGVSIAVGLSWIFMWYLSYRTLHEYQEGFYWKLFLTNLLSVFIWGGIQVFIFREIINLSDVSSRSGAFFEILFAFCSGVLIFLMVNIVHIREFLKMIRSTKNIIKS